MSTAMEKAAVLVEALPYIAKFHSKIVVIKYGGHAMISRELKEAVFTDLALMKYVGMLPVVVHGGGPEITGMLRRLGIESQFAGGMRITDDETMEIAEMVLVGKINKDIVAHLNRIGGKAVGISGKDANLFQAVKKLHQINTPDGKSELVDIGFVGELAQVNPELIDNLLKDNYIPIVAPVAVGENGESYNVNADYAAGSLAAALKADKLIILTDVEGIMTDKNDPSSLISSLRTDEFNSLVEQGKIDGGMIPKVECCLEALNGGVRSTHILDGRTPHSILLEIFTDQGIGTMVEK